MNRAVLWDSRAVLALLETDEIARQKRFELVAGTRRFGGGDCSSTNVLRVQEIKRPFQDIARALTSQRLKLL